MSLSPMPNKAANTVIIYNYKQFTYYLPDFQDQESLLLSWHAFSPESSDVTATIVVNKSGQYFHYASQWPSLWLIMWLTRPKSDNILLMLVFGMGQGVCPSLTSLYRESIECLGMSGTNCHSDYWRWKTKKHWPSIDPYFQNGVESMSLCLAIFQAGNASDNDND